MQQLAVEASTGESVTIDPVVNGIAGLLKTSSVDLGKYGVMQRKVTGRLIAITTGVTTLSQSQKAVQGSVDY